MTDDRVTALERRVADLEALHAVELQGLRDARPEVQAARALEEARERERHDAIRRVEYMVNNKLVFAMQRVPQDGSGKATLHSADALRELLPELDAAIAALRALVERDPWADGQSTLASAEGALAKGRDRLAWFDKELARYEAQRQRRAG